MYFGRRFIIGEGRDYFTDGTLVRGGSAGLSTDIPIVPGTGITARLGANSLTYSTGGSGCSYDILAGGYYNMHWGKRFEGQAKAMAGVALAGNGYIPALTDDSVYITVMNRIGANICAGVSLAFMLDENFKISVFADYDAIESKLFGLCKDHGMGVLTEKWEGTDVPSRAYAEGGIHEAIAYYEDNVFYEILAEELSRRDMDYPEISEDNYDEIVTRMDRYMTEFEVSGVDHLVLED